MVSKNAPATHVNISNSSSSYASSESTTGLPHEGDGIAAIVRGPSEVVGSHQNVLSMVGRVSTSAPKVLPQEGDGIAAIVRGPQEVGSHLNAVAEQTTSHRYQAPLSTDIVRRPPAIGKGGAPHRAAGQLVPGHSRQDHHLHLGNGGGTADDPNVLVGDQHTVGRPSSRLEAGAPSPVSRPPAPLSVALPIEGEASPEYRELGDLAQAILELLSQRLERNADVVDIAVTKASVAELVRAAKERLGESFAPTATFVKGLQGRGLLDALSPELLERQEEKILQSTSLEGWLQGCIEPKLAGSRGLGPPDKMNQFMREYEIDGETREKVVALMYKGQETPLDPSFQPNNGVGVHLGQYYDTISPIFIHEMNRRGQQGDLAFIRESTLRESGLLEGTDWHCSSLTHALKDGSELGRTCYNGSHGNELSLNQGINRAAMDDMYPPPVLTSLADLCEFASEVLDENPGRKIGAATIDFREAFALTPQSPSSARMHAIKIKIPDPATSQATVAPEGGKKNTWLERIKTIVLIGFFLVGAWGFTRAGNVFCLMSSTISRMHNFKRRKTSKRRSTMYIDDGILIDRLDRIFITPDAARNNEQAAYGPSVREYIEISTKMLGQCIQPKKTKLFNQELVAIGWHLDFKTMTAQPNQKGLDKMIVRLFDSIKVGESSIGAKDLERLTGTLMRYSNALLCGSSFLGSLYALQCRGQERGWETIKLTPLAASDLEWWRAIALVTIQQPALMGGTFAMLRTNRVPTLFMRTDASSSTGGGGILSSTPFSKDQPYGSEIPGTEKDSVVRWTQDELDVFVKMGVSINVLEFFMAVFCIILWGGEMQGRVVQEESDSSTTVSWLAKRRATGMKNGCFAADALSKLFTTFCFINRIVLSPPLHVLGIDNGVSDYRSRSLNLQEIVQQVGEAVSEAGALPSTKSQRWLICRKLLMTCITTPGAMRGQRLLKVLTSLSSINGVPTA